MRYEIKGKVKELKYLIFTRLLRKPEKVFHFLGDIELRKIS